jgi:ABC-type Fe3+-hydroxamate transport system substrate-binding protein
VENFTDITGYTLALGASPTRVVSLVPSVTETIFDIGAASCLVGRTRYCVAPDPDVRTIERIGGTKDPDIRRIIALKPDLVLANREENRKPDIEQLRAAGLPVYVDEPCTVEQALAMVSLLGRMLDCAGRADAIVRRGAQQLGAIAQRLRELDELNAHKLKPRSHPRPRALAFIWRDPWMVAGTNTYISDMLKTLGATLAFEDPMPVSPLRQRVAAMRYFTVEPAEVAALAPDVLLFPDEPYTFTERDMALWRDMALTIPAAREGRLRLCSGQDLAWFGSRTAGALSRLQPLVSW